MKEPKEREILRKLYEEKGHPAFSGEPEGENLAIWIAWLKERPECVRKVVAKVPPWKIYRFKKASRCIYVEAVSIYSYDEHDDGAVSLRVSVSCPTHPRQVFGLQPEDLEELETLENRPL